MNNPLGMAESRATHLQTTIIDLANAALMLMQAKYDEAGSASKEGKKSGSEAKAFMAELEKVCNPHSFMHHVIGSVEYEGEGELAYIIITSLNAYARVMQTLPDELKTAIMMMGAAKMMGREFTWKAMILSDEDQMEVTDDGVTMVQHKRIGICDGADSFGWEKAEDVLVFDPVEVFPKYIAEALLNKSDASTHGHIHVDDVGGFYVRCNKHSRFSVFCLSELAGDSVSVHNGVMCMMAVSDVKKLRPSFKFDGSSQIIIRKFDGEVEADGAGMRGEHDLLIAPVM
jgi:hypothetical protein